MCTLTERGGERIVEYKKARDTHMHNYLYLYVSLLDVVAVGWLFGVSRKIQKKNRTFIFFFIFFSIFFPIFVLFL